jgi:hypothetical protein
MRDRQLWVDSGLAERLVCSRCGSRNVDMVVTGTERR